MRSLPEILLIEDNKDDKDLFEMALLACGLQATLTQAMDAAETVKRLNRAGGDRPLPSLIVLDLSLSGLQGRTLLEVIRNAYGAETIPIVILTGSKIPSDRATYEAMCVSEYLIKPTTFVDLVRLVASLQRYLVAPAAAPDTAAQFKFAVPRAR